MISALSSGNVGKYEYLTGKDVLPEKDLLEKAQTDIANKQQQKLDNEKINKKSTPKEYNKSDLIYDTKQFLQLFS